MFIKVTKRFLILISFSLLACGRDGPLLLEGTKESLNQTLADVVPALMEENDIVGLSIEIIRNNHVDISKYFGYADLESKRAVDESTVYRAASLGKPIFAYIVTYLAQQGRIDLDKPLYTYGVEDIIKNDPFSKMITARMVLSHTTGLPNLGAQADLMFYFKLGDSFKYSGLGYQYLQGAIEKITGNSLSELAQEIIFIQLSMTTSSYVWLEGYGEVISSSYGENKNKYAGNSKVLKGHSAWSLYTSIKGYSKFITHMMQSSKIKGSIASQLLVSEVDITKSVKWGLGWGLQDTRPNQSFWHWGSMAGFRHYVVAYPEEKIAVIVMANSSQSFKIIEDIMVASIGGSYPSYDRF